MLQHLRLPALEMKKQISLPTVRVSGWSYGAGKTPIPGVLGQYLEKYGVQYCVLLFALCVLPTFLDSGRQLPTVIQTLLLPLPDMDAGRQASGQMASWMDSLWAGLERTEPGATIRVDKRQKRATANILPVLRLKFNSWVNQSCQHGTFCQHKIAFKVGREMSM